MHTSTFFLLSEGVLHLKEYHSCNRQQPENDYFSIFFLIMEKTKSIKKWREIEIDEGGNAKWYTNL
jgi:hypothetical protein